MEEILIRLQKLENELKKEREINRTLQFQIADMNEEISTLKNNKIELQVNKIEKYLHSIDNIKDIEIMNNTNIIVKSVNLQKSVKANFYFNNCIKNKYLEYTSNESIFYSIQTGIHPKYQSLFDSYLGLNILIPKNKLHSLNQITVFKGENPSNMGSLYCINIDKQDRIILCRVNFGPIQFGNNFYIIGKVLHNDKNHIISYHTDKNYVFNGFTYEEDD